MPLEGQVVHSIAPTLVPDLIVPADHRRQTEDAGEEQQRESWNLSTPPTSTLTPRPPPRWWGSNGIEMELLIPISWKGKKRRGMHRAWKRLEKEK